VLVCEHKDCERRGGKGVLKELKHSLKERSLREAVKVTKVDCFDLCDHGPIVVVYPEGVWYGGVDERGAREIVERHAAGAGGRAACRVLLDMKEAEG
jgi:(2Fe-2S) ferredoxin